MALYRIISMSFWTDSKVADDFTPEDRYFYLYLFTNPHTNLCGCYEISIKQVALETGYGRDTIENLIRRFSEYHDVIRYSPTTKEILLLNWHKYNWTKSEKFRKPLLAEIAAVKNRDFKKYLSKMAEIDNGGYGIDTNCIDTNCIDTSNTNTISNADTISDSIEEEKKEKKHKYGEYKNVLLSDKDMEKLQAEFPDDYTKRIEALSVYMQSKGVRYKDHLATIRNWARKEKQEKPKSKNRFNNFHQREYDYDDMERRLAGL